MSAELSDRDLPGAMSDEAIVRGAWEGVHEYTSKGGGIMVQFGPHALSSWSAARAYTDAVKEEARQRREEIAEIKDDLSCYEPLETFHSIYSRILKRLEDQYAEHVRGLRKEFLEGK